MSTTFFCSTKGSKLWGRQILKSQRTGKPKTLTICRSVVTCNFWSMDISDLPLFGARNSWAWHHFLYLSIPFEKYYQIIKRPKKRQKRVFDWYFNILVVLEMLFGQQKIILILNFGNCPFNGPFLSLLDGIFTLIFLPSPKDNFFSTIPFLRCILEKMIH